MTAVPDSLPRASRLARIARSMTPSERRRAGAMVAVVGCLHLVGFGLLILIVDPRHFRLASGGTFAIGTGITAYTLGLRHAFDADHISAIDNTTRKLMSEGRRPVSVGFFFSLGHSTIVFLLTFLLAIGVKSLVGPVQDDGSTLHQAASAIGTSVSATFLYLIAALNIVILISILRIFRNMRRGVYDEATLEHQLLSRGLMNRLLGRFTNAVTKSWHMYPVGLLFGLGFDTATEVALLVVAAGAGATGVPWYAILCLPTLFAAGMSLLDTIDGSFMNFAYGWAFSQPVRKVYYNITITGLSIMVALFIGTIEIVGLLAKQFGLDGGPIGWSRSVDVNTAGLAIVGMFVVTWAIALAVWHFGRIEERWDVGKQGQPRSTR